MGWFGDIVDSAASGIVDSAAGLGGGLVGGVLGSVFGPSEGSQRRDRRREHRYNVDLVKLGNQLDIDNQKEMFNYRIQQGELAGMTPYEMFMGPAAGAGGGTSGSGQTLGNAANQTAIADKQIAKDRQLAWQTTMANNATQLQQTKMQTEAQKSIAGVQADVTMRGQDIEQAIAAGRLELDRDAYNTNVDLVSSQVGVNKQQLKKLINETATSEKEFVLLMKQLSMGTDNMLVEYFQRHHGISLNNPESWTSLPAQKREELLAAMISLRSTVAVEAGGIQKMFGEPLNNAVKPIIDTFLDLFGILPNGPGIEPAPSLGNYSSEPPQAGPNMNYR